jgi:uncharacterized protein (TIGR02145 family)
MKKFLYSLALVCLVGNIQAQAPQKFSYQTVIRNSSNQLLANQQVGIKISVLQGSETGIVVYSERHTPTTNSNGLATLTIGTGTVLNGNFQSINWASGSYFIQTETDPNGGINYTITSTQQLLSVPYALYANNTSSWVSNSGDTLFIGLQSYIIPGISAANQSSGQTGLTDHTCGTENVHNPAKTYGSMTDQQGNVYKTILIGNQEWMSENLKTSIYRNGDPIENVNDSTLWAETITGAWAYFNNDIQYECPYGKLYNWYVVADPRHVCPTGWHEPNDEEWNILTDYLGGVAIAGGKMKTTGLQYWNNPNQDASNESGFSGLPGNSRSYDGTFNGLGLRGTWWSASQLDSLHAWYRDLHYNYNEATPYGGRKQFGFSVRCIKD